MDPEKSQSSVTAQRVHRHEGMMVSTRPSDHVYEMERENESETKNSRKEIGQYLLPSVATRSRSWKKTKYFLIFSVLIVILVPSPRIDDTKLTTVRTLRLIRKGILERHFHTGK